MEDHPNTRPNADLYAKAAKEFEGALDAYMKEWETSLRAALEGGGGAAPTPKPRQYPERKQRELTEAEKQQLRERIERGASDVYALAREFHCSSSQVAGIKAAMSRCG